MSRRVRETSLAVSAVLLVGVLGAAAPQPAAVELSVLSYNTHGLPAWIAGDDPEARFPKISPLLNAYDVVLIQEDWAYHEMLVADAAHPVIEEGNAARPGLLRALGLANGSGLTSLARLPEQDRLDVTREFLGACAGWFSRANDCWASKGFLRLRLRFANGKAVDFYNVHLDAGSSPEDRAARAAQLAALRARIGELTGERALVIGGDFNLHRERAADAAALRSFREDLRLLDSGAATGPDEDWSRVDYLLYRSGPDVTLVPLAAGPAPEFQADGVPLSDHPALFARFRLQ